LYRLLGSKILEVWQSVFIPVFVRDEELVVLVTSVNRSFNAQRVRTRCIVRRAVPLVFNAMKRNGFGAACTAVLEKLRFPRISWTCISYDDYVVIGFHTSSAWTCTCELASFKFFATTMFAIFRVSSGLNGLGDLGVLLFANRGVPEMGENCPYQPIFAHP
jgi:hypothetical protein